MPPHWIDGRRQMNQDPHNRPHSFFDVDLKHLTGIKFFSGELQKISEVRREATFFDIAPEIGRQAMEILNANDTNENPPYSTMPTFPTRRGFMRISYGDGISYNNDDLHSARVNSVLWDGDVMWLMQDIGVVNTMRFSTFKMILNSPVRDHALILEKGEAVDLSKPQVEIVPICDSYNKKEILAMRTGMSDILCVVSIICDMIAEVRATTLAKTMQEHTFKNKTRPYFERVSVVKINLAKAKKKYLRREAVPTGRKMGWHKPRVHWVHSRVTKPDCKHFWVPRFAEADGKHEKCDICGERRTAREYKNGKGDRSIGRIKTNYEVFAQ